MRKIDRRGFIKTVGMAGMGALVGTALEETNAGADDEAARREVSLVPTRPFGRTGVHVSALGFGGSHNLISKQILMRQALKLGVTYWDTADSYSNSETAMGNYFEKFPDDRKKVFLVTKSYASDSRGLDRALRNSLRQLKCDSVDMYFLHSVSDAAKELSPEIRSWAERSKSRGLIRFFGFSTHKNMERCLQTAAGLGWVDGIMASYNYRLMHTDAMKRAVDACAGAGIGLTAMKTQAPFFAGLWANLGREDSGAAALTEHFIAKGFSAEQAKLKAVWENDQIACICSEMPNMAILKANSTAAAGTGRLSSKDRRVLLLEASRTAPYYCAGCAAICESALGGHIPVGDILRSMMYSQGYGDNDRARQTLKNLRPAITPEGLDTDYTPAERVCPRRIPIAALMRSAVSLLS